MECGVFIVLSIETKLHSLLMITKLVTKYNGQVTDQVGQTVTAQNVYFNKCADKRNIKFAGYCWQMIRTTETGGIKMIYNGEPDNDGECGSSRGDHKGIVGADGSTQTLNASYLYGDSFTYDITNSTFTLTDTTTAFFLSMMQNVSFHHSSVKVRHPTQIPFYSENCLPDLLHPLWFSHI